MTITEHTPGQTGKVTKTGKARRWLTAAAVAAAAVAAPLVLPAAPASAQVSGCSHGYVNANMAWGTCTTGSGHWSLTVQCYFWGANTAYGNGTGSIYATCPAASHVTNITLNTQA
jgi:hypothetical protein